MIALVLFPLGGCAGSLTGGSLSGNDTASFSVEQPAIVPPLPEKRSVRKGETQLLAVAPAQTKQELTKTATSQTGSNLFASLPNFLVSQAGTSDRASSAEDPISVYTRLARNIKGCWLLRANPSLQGHRFHADAAPDGSAKIIIYQKAEGASLGLAAYKIHIDADGKGTEVRGETVRLPAETAEKLQNDLNAWVKGREGCGQGTT
jgi:hypothetical protein